ncbi:MAG: rfbF [Bacillales bacterium]|nr:rfbF [Bacillales bacterium]
MSEKNIYPLRKENVCAIIVTYNPDSDFPHNLMAIKSLANEIIIVDNGSNNLPIIQGWIEKLDGVILLVNKENEGIARALNQGVDWASSHNYNWVYTFDQDSRPSDILIEYHRMIIESLEDKEKISLIGTKHTENEKALDFQFKRQNTLDTIKKNDVFEEVKVTITSGCLMKVSAFKHIGPFRESFFIDAVDHEYSLRAQQSGFKVYETKAPLLLHKIGNNSIHKFFVWNPMTSNHSLARRYYMFRNNMILNKEYLLKEPKWVLTNIQTITRVSVYMLLFEKDKWQKFKVLLKGIPR